jgi:hypothetical protein
MKKRLCGSIALILIACGWCMGIFTPYHLEGSEFFPYLVPIFGALLSGLIGILVDKKKWLAVLAVVLALLSIVLLYLYLFFFRTVIY